MQATLPNNIIEKAVALLKQNPSMAVIVTENDTERRWAISLDGKLPVVDACVGEENSARGIGIYDQCLQCSN